jgi:hypothetical protein
MMVVVASVLWASITVASADARVWLAPVTLSPAGQTAFYPKLSVSPRGGAVAVWQRAQSNAAGSDPVLQVAEVQAAVRPAGAMWQAPGVLSVGGERGFDPQIAVDPQGGAVVVWQGFFGLSGMVRSSTRPASIGWQAPVDLSIAGEGLGFSYATPQVAVGAGGDAVAVWRRDSGGVQAAFRPTGGDWEPAVDLSAPGRDAAYPQVVVDAQGNAVAVWFDDGARRIVSAYRPTGQPWQAPVSVSDLSAAPYGPQIAVNTRGDIVAVWMRSDGKHYIIATAAMKAGGSWQKTIDLSATDGFRNAYEPSIAIDQHGNTVAVWQRSGSGALVIEGAVRPATGVWQSPVRLSAARGRAYAPHVAIDGRGQAIAVWQRSNTIEASVRAPHARWGQPVRLSNPDEDAVFAHVAINERGDASAVWQHNIQPNGPDAVVQSSDFAAGPQITRLRVSPSTLRPRFNRAGQTMAHTRTTVSYTLSTAANVRLALQRPVRGRQRADRRCVAARGADRALPACTRFYRVLRSVSRARPAGRDRVSYSLSALPPGTYRLLATPTSAGRTGRAMSASIKIARRLP